jgi:hypothetical protein
MLRFEEQNIAVESKIRLEKEDIKNILDVKMNKNIGIYHPQQQRPPVQQQRPPVQQQRPPVQQQRPQSQPQNIILPNPQLHPQQVRRNTYRGIGMGGVR